MCKKCGCAVFFKDFESRNCRLCQKNVKRASHLIIISGKHLFVLFYSQIIQFIIEDVLADFPNRFRSADLH